MKKIKKDEEKVFEVNDMGLASALSSSGHQIVKTEKKDGIVYFLFMDDADIEDDAQSYYMGDLRVDALKMSTEQKKLRKIVGAYFRKEQGESRLQAKYITKRDID